MKAYATLTKSEKSILKSRKEEKRQSIKAMKQSHMKLSRPLQLPSVANEAIRNLQNISTKSAKDKAQDTASIYKQQSMLIVPQIGRKEPPIRAKSQDRQRKITKELK